VAHLLKKFLTTTLRAGVACTVVLSAGASTLARAQPADPARVLSELQGFDFGRLPPAAKRELATVLTDEFDGCGRPMTLLASLKKGDACRHTKRMVGLAAGLAAEGSSASEIIGQLARHNQGFGRGRVALTIDERACLGPKDAKVTLVEFSDFECPVCGAVRPLLERFVKDHPSTRLCWSPFPLDMHRHATLCAQAALFARDAGKFWAVHDALYEHAQEISAPLVRKVLADHGLDLKAFDKSIAADTYGAEIKASKDAGRSSGVDGTPTLFVNGRRHVLGFATETLSASVDDELDWMSGHSGWPSK
jgi:protein-disulfide isomerase